MRRARAGVLRALVLVRCVLSRHARAGRRGAGRDDAARSRRASGHADRGRQRRAAVRPQRQQPPGDRERHQADDRAGDARARPSAGRHVHAERLPVGGRGLADRAGSRRADERSRPDDRADASQRRRRRRRPRVQRRPRVGREVRRDDERTGAPARPGAHALLDADRAGHAGQLLERFRPGQARRLSAATPRRSSSGSSRSRARFCIPATTCERSSTETTSSPRSHGSTASRPATRCRRGTSWSARGPGTG